MAERGSFIDEELTNEEFAARKANASAVGEELDKVYWYFGTGKLYAEPKEKPARSDDSEDDIFWSIECSSLKQWEGLMRRLKRSTGDSEKKLAQSLTDIFPGVKQILEERAARMEEKKGEERSEDLLKKKTPKKPRANSSGLDVREKNRYEVNYEHSEEGRNQELDDVPKLGGGRGAKASRRAARNCLRQQRVELSGDDEISSEDEWAGKRRKVKEDSDEDFLDEPVKKRKKSTSTSKRRMSSEYQSNQHRVISHPPKIPTERRRILVFSTGLANLAAEAVENLKVDSILTFHQQHPSPTGLIMDTVPGNQYPKPGDAQGRSPGYPGDPRYGKPSGIRMPPWDMSMNRMFAKPTSWQPTSFGVPSADMSAHPPPNQQYPGQHHQGNLFQAPPAGYPHTSGGYRPLTHPPPTHPQYPGYPTPHPYPGNGAHPHVTGGGEFSVEDITSMLLSGQPNAHSSIAQPAGPYGIPGQPDFYRGPHPGHMTAAPNHMAPPTDPSAYAQYHQAAPGPYAPPQGLIGREYYAQSAGAHRGDLSMHPEFQHPWAVPQQRPYQHYPHPSPAHHPQHQQQQQRVSSSTPQAFDTRSDHSDKSGYPGGFNAGNPPRPSSGNMGSPQTQPYSHNRPPPPPYQGHEGGGDVAHDGSFGRPPSHHGSQPGTPAAGWRPPSGGPRSAEPLSHPLTSVSAGEHARNVLSGISQADATGARGLLDLAGVGKPAVYPGFPSQVPGSRVQDPLHFLAKVTGQQHPMGSPAEKTEMDQQKNESAIEDQNGSGSNKRASSFSIENLTAPQNSEPSKSAVSLPSAYVPMGMNSLPVQSGWAPSGFMPSNDCSVGHGDNVGVSSEGEATAHRGDSAGEEKA
eukprot:m.6250 g.6250  ORF g.6250 m.6250 type:complete len:856 (+) comp15371_c0_seq1:147-2714(+)